MKNSSNIKGQALVEFAVVLPILLLVVMGVIEFGIMLNSYLTLQNVTREGVRAGALGSSNNEIESIIKSGSIGMEESNISIAITPDDGSRSTGEILTIKVIYNYQLTIPIISSIFIDKTVPLQAEVSMRIE